MNVIHHPVSNGSLWQFSSQQLSHALAFSFQKCATTNRIKENKWKLAWAFFLFSRSLSFRLNLLPFHCRQKTGTLGRFVSSAYLGDKTRVNLDVLWTSRRFHFGLWGENVFEHGPTHAPRPTKPQIPCSPQSELGTEGKEQIDTDILRVLRVTFLSGVAAHQAEIKRPRFMISSSEIHVTKNRCFLWFVRLFSQKTSSLPFFVAKCASVQPTHWRKQQ